MSRTAASLLEGVTTRIIEIDPNELKLLEVNARRMTHEQYQRLVENIKRDGALTSVPFACLDDDGRYLVLSGNHRTRASRDAGLTKIAVMVTDDPLDHQRRVAIQLSHNAIAGEDDPTILASLYDELEDVDWRAYAGLDDKALKLLEQVTIGSLSEANLDFTTISIVFLPNEAARVKAAFDVAKKELTAHEWWLARWAEYDQTLDALEVAGASFKIKNVATCLNLVLGIFERHITDLQGGYLDAEGEPLHEGWVPLSTIFGTDRVPAAAAAVLARAVAKMADHAIVTPDAKWRALELWAADALAGV